MFVVLLGWALLAGTFQAAAAPATLVAPAVPGVSVAPAVPVGEAPAASGQVAVRASAPAEPGSSVPVAVFAASAGPGGPACAPGSGDRDGVPALPARARSDQAQAPAPPARPGPEVVVPPRAIPVRVLVRGPGQSAPSPLELSVMRV
ncbi:hypothetical protein ACFYM0_35500 [Streptomyces sp. NPDC006487]|uniref:hypothetical protein n=1 Tax=Streptomyces sp. NPDC006487 TaxID=3364748 RepID=UPI0036AF38DE